MIHLTDAQKTLLGLLGNTLFGAEKPALTGDTVALCMEAHQQTVFLTALRNADADVFPPELLDEIRQGVRLRITKNVRLANAHASLSAMLEQAGIGHVLIKGHVSALWYPEPELRQLGDVDFYVDQKDVSRTKALLAREGFTAEKTSHRFHYVFSKDGLRYELHFSVPGIPEGAAGERCREYFRDMIARSAVRHTPFGDMRLPSAFHHGLILLLHAAHHLTNSGIGLRHLCDWAVFADTVPPAEFREMYEKCLHTLGLWRFACCLTDICVRYLHMEPKAWAADPDRALGDDLLADFFASGNFGQKDVVRTRQAYLITSGQAHHSKLRQFFSVLLDMIYQKWPLSKKIKLLVPFGWAFYALRYLFRRLAGKRPKLYVRAAVRGADARIALYDKLRLFDGAKEDLED